MALIKEVKPTARRVTTTSVRGTVQGDLDVAYALLDWVSTPGLEGAVGDGVADDTAALNSMFSKSSGVVELPPNKVYKVSGPLLAPNVHTIKAHGSTIRLVGTPASTLTVLTLGKSKGTLSGLSVAAAVGATSLTIPGIGALVSPGDLLSLRSSTVRVSAPESNYLFGQRCIVRSVSGDTVTLVDPIHETFSVSACSVHAGGPISVDGLILDLTQVPSTTFLVEGLSVTGVGITVSNCSIMGSQYCSAGLVVQGCTADIRGNTISGFLNANGVSSGGRTGYGIYLDCNNTVVAANMLTGCKHQLTCASRSYVMQGLTVDSNTVSSAGTPTSEATLDLHANVVGAPIFSRNSIYAVRAAFGIRNGGARILDNDIVCQRPSDTTPALIGLDEYPNVYCIEVSGNRLDCSSNLRMLSLGELQVVDGITIRGNKGTIGSLMDQAMNVGILSNVRILDNRLSGMTKIIDINRRSAASTQTMFAKASSLTIRGNTFDCSNDTLSNFALSLWTHANTAIANKLVVEDLLVEDNLVISQDTPVQFDYVNFAGACVFRNNTLRHTVTSSPVTPPTQFSMVLLNCGVPDMVFSGNNLSGMLRLLMLSTQAATAVAYPAETVTWRVDLNHNTGFGVSFEKNATTDHVVLVGNSKISGNRFRHLYGTPIGWVTSPSNLWGSNTALVDISDNVLITGSSNALGIGVGWGTHNIVVRNNLVAGAIQDSSTAKVAPVNNTSITL